MRVLWFERDAKTFKSPQIGRRCRRNGVDPRFADGRRMVAWQRPQRGSSIPTLANNEKADRVTDRPGSGMPYAPQKQRTERCHLTLTSSVSQTLLSLCQETPSHLALLPLEDALASIEQPNLPGTIDQHPNWRRRYPADAAELLTDVHVRKRVKLLAARGKNDSSARHLPASTASRVYICRRSRSYRTFQLSA